MGITFTSGKTGLSPGGAIGQRTQELLNEYLVNVIFTDLHIYTRCLRKQLKH